MSFLRGLFEWLGEGPVNHACDNTARHRYLCGRPNPDGDGSGCTGLGIALEEPRRITCAGCRGAVDAQRFIDGKRGGSR